MAQGKNQWVKPLSNAVSLGTSIAAAIALPTWVGTRLDQSYETGVLWTLVGLLFGMLTSGKMVWSRLMKDDSSNQSVYKKKADEVSTDESQSANFMDASPNADEEGEEDSPSWW